MEEKDIKNAVDNLEQTANQQDSVSQTDISTDTSTVEGSTEEVTLVEKLEQELAAMKDKYIRQAAEFENYKRRTAKERIELVQTAGKDVIVSLLDVLDDCDRAQQQVETSSDTTTKEGVLLVFNKLRSVLQAKGLKAMKSVGEPFNPDVHEAITEIPAPTPELKGMVVDEVTKGYYLNDKIIRFAKVVVGK